MCVFVVVEDEKDFEKGIRIDVYTYDKTFERQKDTFLL